MKTKKYILVSTILFLLVSYSSSSYAPKDTARTKKTDEKVKNKVSYNFDIILGIGTLQGFRIGTNIYISDNTSLLFTHGPAYANATLIAVIGGVVPNEFYTYSAGIDYNYKGLIGGIELMFKENFNPYYKNFIIVAPKFTYRTNHDKKFYIGVGFSPYFGYYSHTHDFRSRGLNILFDFGIRY